MNCEFCQKPLKFSHHENNNEVEVYDCHNCKVLTSFYFFHKDGSQFKTVFMIDKNEKSYTWTNNYVKGISYIVDVGTSINKDRDPVLIRFPKIMNISPTNIYEKFAFYMVFL